MAWVLNKICSWLLRKEVGNRIWHKLQEGSLNKLPSMGWKRYLLRVRYLETADLFSLTARVCHSSQWRQERWGEMGRVWVWVWVLSNDHFPAGGGLTGRPGLLTEGSILLPESLILTLDSSLLTAQSVYILRPRVHPGHLLCPIPRPVVRRSPVVTNCCVWPHYNHGTQ